MKYSTHDIKIKTNWFDEGKNKYQQIGYEGLNLYLSLFRFYIGDQSPEYSRYTFAVCISWLRKVTGYTAVRIEELIRLLHRHKVIKTDVSRWSDYMFDENGKINATKAFIIYSTDHPQTIKDHGVDCPVGAEDTYISVNLELMQHYKDIGLHERYYALYCLLKKNSNTGQFKSWMGYDKMADVLGVAKDTMTNMIHTMNKESLLATYFKESENNLMRVVKGKRVNAVSSEHYLLYKLKDMDEFLKTHGKQIQKNKTEWSKYEPQNAN